MLWQKKYQTDNSYQSSVSVDKRTQNLLQQSTYRIFKLSLYSLILHPVTPTVARIDTMSRCIRHRQLCTQTLFFAIRLELNDRSKNPPFPHPHPPHPYPTSTGHRQHPINFSSDRTRSTRDLAPIVHSFELFWEWHSRRPGKNSSGQLEKSD